jgi:ribonuclease BN (tRNA processing enzyme)
MQDEPPSALPVFAPAGALGPVLALDRPGMLDDAIALHEFTPGDRLEIGPFGLCSWLLPHWVPNAGLRLEASGQVLAYTGDSGPSPLLAELARGAGLFLAEATNPWQVEGDTARYLSSALQAGAVAREAGAGRLVLTHLWPGTDPDEAVRAAAASYPGEIAVASPGLVTDLAPRRE